MSKLGLFEGFGVELEYIIADADTLDVRPVTDLLMRDKSGEFTDELENGEIAWSNELALHVVEVKTNGPAPSLDNLAASFHSNLMEIERYLSGHNCRLLPGAMHPWMDPFKELRLWPHEHNQVYSLYNSIFDCRGHGWANLQSTHLNLPFNNDEEFGRLHAAIRLVLPIIPALAASSPVMDGKPSGLSDSRLNVYQKNQARIPSIAGKVIPEPVFTEQNYRDKILAKNYADIRPFDPDGILQHEWLNSRGAIARFTRGAIEIRVIDIQECPAADIALLKLVIAAVRELCEERFVSNADQKKWAVETLYSIFQDGVHHGSDQLIANPDYLRLFSVEGEKSRAMDIWQAVSKRANLNAIEQEWVSLVLTEGNLSARILRALGPDPGREQLFEAWSRLGDCLRKQQFFR